MLSICGKDCCEKCSRKESCGGCIKVKGHPFGGQCVAANWVQNFGREGMEERKQALIQEINAYSRSSHHGLKFAQWILCESGISFTKWTDG